MKKILLILLSIISFSISSFNNTKLNGIIISKNESQILFQDNKNIIHSFKTTDLNLNVGTKVTIKYDNNHISYETIQYQNNIPFYLLDNSMFSNYYNLAYKKLQTLSLEEKISQILLVRYDENIENLKKYKFGGYVFYEKDFKNKTIKEVQEMTNTLQNNSNIPLLMAVDEEGGKVTRISSNPNLSDSKFQSPREIYNLGGLELIKQDTLNKINLLSNLGINLNLAPVVDVSTNKNDYMYQRSIGQSTEITSEFAKTVIETSKNSKVSFTLKHFPGYGNNIDTHTQSAIDNRSYEYILKNDIPPFKSGIKAGAEAILISHNIVTSIDNNPASLSFKIHNLLRDELDFTGIIITDDLSMGATNKIEDATIKAIISGNDMIIVTDYEQSIKEIKKALSENIISESLIDKLAFRIIAWKYYKGLIN